MNQLKTFLFNYFRDHEPNLFENKQEVIRCWNVIENAITDVVPHQLIEEIDDLDSISNRIPHTLQWVRNIKENLSPGLRKKALKHFKTNTLVQNRVNFRAGWIIDDIFCFHFSVDSSYGIFQSIFHSHIVLYTGTPLRGQPFGRTLNGVTESHLCSCRAGNRIGGTLQTVTIPVCTHAEMSNLTMGFSRFPNERPVGVQRNQEGGIHRKKRFSLETGFPGDNRPITRRLDPLEIQAPVITTCLNQATINHIQGIVNNTLLQRGLITNNPIHPMFGPLNRTPQNDEEMGDNDEDEDADEDADDEDDEDDDDDDDDDDEEEEEEEEEDNIDQMDIDTNENNNNEEQRRLSNMYTRLGGRKNRGVPSQNPYH